MNQAISWLAPRIAWVVLAIPIAFGSAGLITGLDHRPGTPAREELTWGGDQMLTPGLNSIVAGMNPVALDFDALAQQARSAIAALDSANPAALNQAIATGGTLVDKITVETTRLRSQLRALPGIGTNSTLQLSPDVITRWTTVDKASWRLDNGHRGELGGALGRQRNGESAGDLAPGPRHAAWARP